MKKSKDNLINYFIAFIFIILNALILLDTFVFEREMPSLSGKNSIENHLFFGAIQPAQYRMINQEVKNKNAKKAAEDKLKKEQAEEKKRNMPPRIGANYYYDNDISIHINKVKKNSTEIYVAEVKLSDVKFLKSAFANGKFGRNIVDQTSNIAKENDAIFAVNGDYCGFRNDGIIIRSKELFRNEPIRDMLAVKTTGELSIINEHDFDTESYLSNHILHTFSFGPALIENGEIVNFRERTKDRNGKSTGPSIGGRNPRTGFGMIEPLNYVFIVADGRSKTSRGMDLTEFAEVFKEYGCVNAYNLDGGGTSTMWFNGEVVNKPSNGKERRLSDIIYIGK